ncbi:hypothetical protein AHIS1636_23880 [Arthrobacter mangrovi]|uniref:Uncharacterized protein n=1 Tax=Arthrobacter mangrovi TaxID=2966350 RepID=A0ABQ5MVE5_9MICC|nr:hypothetical protein AHIS1636_23880 [Arthrobacter mangrovi]
MRGPVRRRRGSFASQRSEHGYARTKEFCLPESEPFITQGPFRWRAPNSAEQKDVATTAAGPDCTDNVSGSGKTTGRPSGFGRDLWWKPSAAASVTPTGSPLALPAPGPAAAPIRRAGGLIAQPVEDM